MDPLRRTKCQRSWLSMQLIWDTLSNSPISELRSRQLALAAAYISSSMSGPHPLSTVDLFNSASALLDLLFFSSFSVLEKRILLSDSTLLTFLLTRGSCLSNTSLSGISLTSRLALRSLISRISLMSPSLLLLFISRTRLGSGVDDLQRIKNVRISSVLQAGLGCYCNQLIAVSSAVASWWGTTMKFLPFSESFDPSFSKSWCWEEAA